MAFSTVLTLTDLNDFITPSQTCIKPVSTVPSTSQREKGAAETEIRIDSGGAYYEVGSGDGDRAASTRLAKAQINLNDCLACSGCITSAESVLITLQSNAEVLSLLEENNQSRDDKGKKKKEVVVSIAPQVLASFVIALSNGSSPSSASSSSTPLSPHQVLLRLRTFLMQVGVDHVFDTTFAREIVLREHVSEWVERKAKAEAEQREEEGGGKMSLPMISSACPGWVCYAEKTHGEILPLVARTKSPQQVMGSLVKELMGIGWGRRADEIYHVCVMPCYDKKLEASREEFFDAELGTRDVDCVITAGELWELVGHFGWDLRKCAETGSPANSLAEAIQRRGTSSGSYLQSIIEHIQGTHRSRGERLRLDVKQIRNVDYEEYKLVDEDSGKVVFSGARCYGFRNLKTVVVRNRKKYEYIEVMACPGGCVNGGGQVKGGDKRLVEEAYWRMEDGEGEGEGDVDVEESVTRVMKEMSRTSLRTSYRAVQSDPVQLAVNW